MPTYIAFIVLIICVVACNPATDKKLLPEATRNNIAKDTFYVTETCAVTYHADTALINAQMEEQGDETFMHSAEQYMFYINQCTDFLNSMSVKTIDTKMPCIKFVHPDKSFDVIDLSNSNSMWAIYLFQPGKHPRLIDLKNVESEYENYFQ